MGELPHHHEDRKRLERLRSFIQEPESFQEVANLCRLLSDNSRVRIFWASALSCCAARAARSSRV